MVDYTWLFKGLLEMEEPHGFVYAKAYKNLTSPVRMDSVTHKPRAWILNYLIDTPKGTKYLKCLHGRGWTDVLETFLSVDPSYIICFIIFDDYDIKHSLYKIFDVDESFKMFGSFEYDGRKFYSKEVK